MTTTLTWHDARTESPENTGPFLCVTTEGKIKTEKYFAKAKIHGGKTISIRLFFGLMLNCRSCQARKNAWIGTGKADVYSGMPTLTPSIDVMRK